MNTFWQTVLLASALAALVFTASLSEAKGRRSRRAPATPEFHETLLVHIPDNWAKIVDRPGLTEVHEWIPQGQDLEHWQLKYAINIMHEKPTPRRDAMMLRSFLSLLGQHCRTGRTLFQSVVKDPILNIKVGFIAHSCPGAENRPAEMSFFKIISAPDATYLLQYLVRSETESDAMTLTALDEAFPNWKSDLRFASICQDDDVSKCLVL